MFLSKNDNFGTIPIGAKVEMTVFDPLEGKLDIDFISQIEGAIDDSIIQISAPIFEAKVYPVKVNSKIEAFLYWESHVYKFVGFVADRLVINEIPILSVRMTEKIQRIQRRTFFRFNCSVPVILSEMHEGQEQNIAIPGLTHDLSGGGMSAVTDKPLKKGSILKGSLQLEDGYSVNFEGKVIRIEKLMTNEVSYISSLSFINIGYKDREKVVGYIFDQQRKLLKKGLR